MVVGVFAFNFFTHFKSSLKKVQTIPVSLPPQPTGVAAKSTSDITITVRSDGSLNADGKPIAFEALEKLLKEKTSDPATNVIVKTESENAFGTTVKVLDAIRTAGIQKVTIETSYRLKAQ
ncbi:MAG: biopolymer transporter ExbD [Nibricoccus sp.]